MDIKKIEKIYVKLLKVNYLLTANVAEIAKDYNFNNSELMIYLDIKAHPNTDLNALCARLGLKKSAASKAINKLIKQKRITSEVNAEDQRKVALNYVELENNSLCQATMLGKTFSGLDPNSCDLTKIELSLDEIIKMLNGAAVKR